MFGGEGGGCSALYIAFLVIMLCCLRNDLTKEKFWSEKLINNEKKIDQSRSRFVSLD